MKTLPSVDVVMIGLGWTNSIMGMELTDEGLEVLALERGEDRDTVPDFAYPKMLDELTYGLRYKLMQDAAKETVTLRHKIGDTAVPYRQLGSFLPGNGVGGAGVHWNGMVWRPQPQELRLRSYATEHFGANIIPEGMTIQDHGVEYDELEPFFTRFERIVGVSGRVGNLNGHTQAGGNPFEGWRSTQYPMPPIKRLFNQQMFIDAVKDFGYHPFPIPAANASEAYVNPYGMQLGPCNFCGYCERYACINYSKSSPQTCVLGALKQRRNFHYRTRSEVTRIVLDNTGKRAIGVIYVDAQGNEYMQPADLVTLGSFSLNNVHLLLLSHIGEPYDPISNTGTLGRNYAYQMMGNTNLFFKNHEFNPFIGAGASGEVIDDFGTNQNDYGRDGFIGGAYIYSAQTNGQPIHSTALPAGTARWGRGWKTATRDWYGHSMSIGAHGSNMAYRDCYLDLDPTYKNHLGLPLMRMTFNWKENDIRQNQFMKKKIEEIARHMNPDSVDSAYKGPGSHYDSRLYQSTHNVGGAIMGTSPKNSVLNRYLQHWDVHNLFVLGASAFPQNLQYNPTGLVGALTLWAAKAIREQYLKSPGPLVQA